MNRRCLNCMKVFMIPEGYEDDDNCCPFCGFIENTLPDNVSYLRTGVQLQDRYTIGTVIGAGGFGITYKAWDSALETIVAIKEFFGFSDNSDRVAYGTDYSSTVYSTSNKSGMWWLRSSGLSDDTLSNESHINNSMKQLVTKNGVVSYKGLINEAESIGVRPVICIDLTSPLVTINE